MARVIQMSDRELTRLRVMIDLADDRLTVDAAAILMGLGRRQIYRLRRVFSADGPAGLASRKRGRPSNRKRGESFRATVLSLVRERYIDFGPTLAAEKLIARHGLRLGIETLRQWMMAERLWVDRRHKLPSPHQPRRRRECLGELVQIDGSEHRWFEDRGEMSTLLAFVDDATSRLMHLRFVASESAFAYFRATKDYLETHGKPVAFYSDKHGIFRVNAKDAIGGDRVTQFGRVLSELNIDIICANSPQAKGHVERAFGTLQDRLVKELRLAGISTIEAANAWLPAFIVDYNTRFGRAPENPKDLHRRLTEADDLSEVLAWREERTVTKNLTLHYDRMMLLLDPGQPPVHRHRLDDPAACGRPRGPKRGLPRASQPIAATGRAAVGHLVSARRRQHTRPGLHTLIGYIARPSGVELLAYVLTLLAIGISMRAVSNAGKAPAGVAAMIVATLVCGARPAWADLHVRMPTVDYRELEFEHNGLFTFDQKGSDLNGQQSYTNAIGYGVLPWWKIELEGELAGGPGVERTWEATTLENTFQLTEPGKYFFNLGLFVEYSQATGQTSTNSFTFGPIIQKELNNVLGVDSLHTLNVFFSRDVGRGSTSATGFQYAWQSRLLLNYHIDPAVEFYGSADNITHAGPFSSQQHFVGPALVGAWSFAPLGKLKYEVGYLFGCTAATPRGALRWLLEYEIAF